MTWTIDAHDNRIHHADSAAAIQHADDLVRAGRGPVTIAGPCGACGQQTPPCWVCRPTNEETK